LQYPIALRRFEAGRHAFLALNGDVQIGWCFRESPRAWIVTDVDDNRLAGPFPTLAEAEEAGIKVLQPWGGASNPGW
jgi:hypothetical protein